MAFRSVDEQGNRSDLQDKGCAGYAGPRRGGFVRVDLQVFTLFIVAIGAQVRHYEATIFLITSFRDVRVVENSVDRITLHSI